MTIAALGTLLIGLATAAQTGGGDPATTPVTQAGKDAAASANKAHPAAASDGKSAPSAALLEYLGQYEDAADGLDPLGFEGDESKQNGKTANADKDADKQGSGP